MLILHSRVSSIVAAFVLAGCSGASSSSASPAGASRDGDASYGPPVSGASDAGAYTDRSPSGVSGETYADVPENDFIETSKEPTSTFAADVDTGSYSLMRRDVSAGRLPNPKGVRPEEYVNYFKYSYAPPTGEHPFAVHVEGAPSKFGDGLHLVRIGLHGKVVHEDQRKPVNLVFLVDISGSMQSADKLPLVQYALKQLVKRLAPSDTLGIVTYAGADRVLLAPSPVVNKSAILDAIDGLSAGGSTNGAGGIRAAYDAAAKALRAGGVNRVVLCTDGDFNVGVTGDALIALIEKERDRGINLTTLGFGSGNYNDKQLEQLADHGNGNYAYIDGPGEANRALGDKLVSTLEVIAQDVKIQVEWRPETVERYRLVGYENRVMANDDFRNDAKDAGELGAGHSVTAFYEIALTSSARASSTAIAAGLGTVRLRYKQPDATATDTAAEFAAPIGNVAATFEAASPDFRFAAAITEYSEILRQSKHSQGARFADVLGIASATAGEEADRLELVHLVRTASTLQR